MILDRSWYFRQDTKSRNNNRKNKLDFIKKYFLSGSWGFWSGENSQPVQPWVTYPRWHEMWSIALDVSLLQTASSLEWLAPVRENPSQFPGAKWKLPGAISGNLGRRSPWPGSICRGHRGPIWGAINCYRNRKSVYLTQSEAHQY